MFNWLKDKFTRIDAETQEKIDVLNSVKLFENCRQEDLLSIADLCQFVEMNSGDKIIEKNSSAGGLYIIESGRVSVHLDADSAPVATMGPEEYVGEMSLIDKKNRSADVICTEEGRLLLLTQKAFLSLLQTKKETAMRMLYVLSLTLSRRLRETNKKLSAKE